MALDPEHDHVRIAYLDSFCEFPFDTTRSLEVALFRTFAVPSVAALLAQTGEFTQRAQKRYDDTDLVLSELLEHGYDSERGRAALRRMNQLHGRFAISNEDYLYVLSTFIFEPIRWNARFGWRRYVENEKLASYYYWREVGRRMAIKDIPANYAAFERYNLDYEREHFRRSDAGERVAGSTRDLFLGWFLPRPLWPIGAPALYAILDDPLREAFGFPRPAPAVRQLVEGAVRLRGRVAGWLPERRRPRLRTGPRRHTYPRGYQVETLGPRIDGPAEKKPPAEREAA